MPTCRWRFCYIPGTSPTLWSNNISIKSLKLNLGEMEEVQLKPGNGHARARRWAPCRPSPQEEREETGLDGQGRGAPDELRAQGFPGRAFLQGGMRSG